ncbi:hypothetical protein DPM19_29445 [Actinomadura craniellae]|uniref:Glycosyltransferase RgtA/B/C/D-like domain-containing protein n=1 Tax=Actinomadura craniellae TaxID=2231787 RepID=A0A365GY31_9ACTN|nr:glycosyltransferase family 39 protein [Actinomadura craniellae]RAY11737.1 hypothetical protein DPM19_29445 [Actinomadura craniellae]
MSSARLRSPGLLVPLLLATGWLVVLVMHLRQPFPSDQINYMRTAAQFPDPLNSALTHQITRFGLVIPLRLSIALFGYSQAAYYSVALLGSLGLLLGTYTLGALLFSRWVGVVAAIVVVAAPPLFIESSDPLPDVPAAALITLALALAVAIRQGRVPVRWWTLAGLGALLGWSYLVREFTVFLWPLVPLLIYPRVRRRGLLQVAWPVALAGLLEALLCQVLYGNPLARVHSITGHGQAPSPPAIAATYRDKPRSVYVLRLPDVLAEHAGSGRLVLLIVFTLLGGALAALLWRRAPRWRELALPAAWFLALWVPLVLLGGVLDPAAPKLRLQLMRYWFPIFPAFALGGVGLVWLAAREAADRLSRRAATVATALPAVLVLLLGAVTAGPAVRSWWAESGTRAGGATQLAAFRTWMSEHGDGVPRVWSGRHTVRLLEIYRRGPFGGVAWQAKPTAALIGGARPAPGDLVVFYDTDRGALCGFCRLTTEDIWGKPPRPEAGWREVYATPDRLLRVYSVGTG